MSMVYIHWQSLITLHNNPTPLRRFSMSGNLCYPPTFTMLLATCSRQWRNFWNVQNSGNAIVTTCHAP